MKKILPLFLSLVVIIYEILPTFTIKADTMPTSSQYEQIGAFAFSQLLQSGEASELDFSDYTGDGTDFLIDLGQALFTGDFTGLIQYGLDWLGDTADYAISAIQDSVHQLIYNMSPELYNAWYGDVLNQSYIELQNFDKTNHLGFDLRNLFTPQGDNNIDPSPSPDFSFINNIQHIYYGAYDFLSPTLPYCSLDGSAYRIQLNFTPNSVSYYVDLDGITHYPDQRYSIYRTFCPLSDILTINYNSTTNQATYVGGSFRNDLWTYTDYGNVAYGSCINFLRVTDVYQWYGYSGNVWDMSQYNSNTYTFRTDFPDISTAMNYFFQHFANVDIYVDGNLWAKHISSSPSYPIVIPDTLTIWGGQNLNYQFPDHTYIDLSSLTSIIRTAINNSDVVHWSDIESTYVDINGQQAVAVTRIYRNDDDNLYIEQYQNITLPKFSHNQISILGNYINPVTQVVEDSTDVLPSELVTLFKVAVILMLFACIVHRLLE